MSFSSQPPSPGSRRGGPATALPRPKRPSHAAFRPPDGLPNPLASERGVILLLRRLAGFHNRWAGLNPFIHAAAGQPWGRTAGRHTSRNAGTPLASHLEAESVTSGPPGRHIRPVRHAKSEAPSHRDRRSVTLSESTERMRRKRERDRLAEQDAGTPWEGLVGEERERAIRDDHGYAPSETRSQAER